MMFALLLAGCASSLDLGRATTLDPGVSRVGVGSELQLLRADQRPGQPTIPAPWIQVAAGWHLGLPHEWEVGVRAWGMDLPTAFAAAGAAVDTKHVLHHSSGNGDPHVSLGASAWWHMTTLGGAPWEVGGFTVPVFLGYDIKRSQLILSPRVLGAIETSYGQTPIPLFGIGAGLAWDIAAGRHLHVTPEVAWTWTPLGFDGEVADADRVGARNFETGVGMSWEIGGKATK